MNNPETNASLPLLVDIGATRRTINAYRPPADVRAAADLPARLFVGDLVPESFRFTPSGWEAEYADETPDTGARVRYVRGIGLLIVEQTWRGHRGLLTMARVNRWEEIPRHVGSLPRAWNEEIRRRLFREYGLEYVSVPPGEPEPVFFPDGFLVTIYLPLPIEALPGLPSVLERLDRDARVRTSVGLTVALGCSTVYYAHDNWSADVPREPIQIARWTLDAGVVACRMPQQFTTPDGIVVTEIRRFHYGSIAQCFFRDLERVVGALAEAGSLPLARGGGRGVPDVPEFRGIVLAGMGVLGQVRLRERDGYRYILYDSLVNRDAFLSPGRIAANSRSREHVDADLAQLVREAEKVRRTFRSLFGDV